ncbi:unnamed protein product [Rotaria magnacalcarata]|uniref:Uncharacterized protein n=1 Tax=Rotaria magnacalcarata TaxID=392030 RepID=A0A815MF91_9BILA|nr:unnamed protein product [Rotaria magnacalcarata]CAF3754231.1 unnamed protein product [Rotaria magnacalcarata]
MSLPPACSCGYRVSKYNNAYITMVRSGMPWDAIVEKLQLGTCCMIVLKTACRVWDQVLEHGEYQRRQKSRYVHVFDDPDVVPPALQAQYDKEAGLETLEADIEKKEQEEKEVVGMDEEEEVEIIQAVVNARDASSHEEEEEEEADKDVQKGFRTEAEEEEDEADDDDDGEQEDEEEEDDEEEEEEAEEHEDEDD